MFTPTEQAVPGQSPTIDPLQMQFLTAGQMGYMPQAQYLTPSMYGSFRTLPTSNVNTAPSEGGLWYNWQLRSNEENPSRLLAYFSNTYNPAVSATQQGTYASRRLSDTADVAKAELANVGLQTAIAATGFIPWMTIPSMAMSMLAPDVSKPVVDRIRTTREIQDLSTHKIFSGSDVDADLGYGFSKRAARDIDRFIRKEAASDTVLEKGDYQELLKLGTKYGQFDNANSADQYKRTLKKMRGVLDTIMQVMGSSDLEEVVKNMNRMRDMGATMDRYEGIARREQLGARMLGMSHSDAVESYGKPGALVFQQAGLNPIQGSLEAIGHAANMTYLKRTGVLDPVTEAKFGGISGLTQELTAQSAQAYNSIEMTLLPGLMNDEMTGLRKDIDLRQLARDPKALNAVRQRSISVLSNPQKYLNYTQHKHLAMAEFLSDKDAAEDVKMGYAGQLGVMFGYSGATAVDMGLMQLGYGPEGAAKIRQAYYSDDIRAAKKRAEEQAEYDKRKKHDQENSFFNQFGRAWHRWANDFYGEGLFSVFAGDKFNKESDLTPMQKQERGQAEPGTSRGPVDDNQPVPMPNNDQSGPVSPNPVPGKSEKDILDIHMKKGKLSEEEGEIYLHTTSAGLFNAEVSKTDPMEAMRTVNAHAMGGYQITLEELASNFWDKEYTKPYQEKYFKGLDKKTLMGAWEKLKNEDGRATKLFAKGDAASIEALKKEYGLTDAEIKQVQLVQSGWKQAVEDKGFRAAQISFTKDNTLVDRMANARKIEAPNRKMMYQAASGSLTFMKALESVGNRSTVGKFENIINTFFQHKDEKSIAESIAKDGGLSLTHEFLETAHKYYNENRYKRGSEKYEGDFLEAEHRGMRENPGDGGEEHPGMSSVMSNIAQNVWSNDAFSGTSSSNTFNDTGLKGAKTIRHDCSGYVAGTFREWQEQLKDQGTLKEPIRRAMTAGGVGEGTAGQLAAFRKAIGDKERKYNFKGKSDKEIAEALKKNLKEGDVFYTKDASGRTVHTGIVVRGANGQLMIAENNFSHKRVMRSIEDAVQGGYGKALRGGTYAGGMSVFNAYDAYDWKKGAPSSIPDTAQPSPNTPNKDEEAARAWEDATKKAAQMQQISLPAVKDQPNFGKGGFFDILEAYIAYGRGNPHQVEGRDIDTWLYSKTLSETSSASELGIDLGQLIGNNAEVRIDDVKSGLEIDAENTQELLGNWGHFAGKYNDKSRGLWEKAVRGVLARAKGVDPDAVKKYEIENFMKNKDAMNTLRAMMLQIYKPGDGNDPSKDPDKHPEYKFSAELFKEGERKIAQYTGGPVDRGNRGTNGAVFRELFAKPLGISFYAGSAEGEFNADSSRFGGVISATKNDIDLMGNPLTPQDRAAYDAIHKAETAYKKAVIRSDKAGKAQRKEGAYYEQTATIMNLYNEYSKADKKGYTKQQKNALLAKLEEVGKAFGLDSGAITKLATGGKSNYEFTKNVFEAAGLKLDGKSDVTDLLSGTAALFDREKAGFKVDLNPILNKDYTQLFDTNNGDYQQRVDQYTNTLLRIGEYLQGTSLDDFTDKSKTSDVKAKQVIKLLRANKYDKTAELFEKARKNGTKITNQDISSAILADAGIPQGVPGQTSDPFRKGAPAGGAMPAPVAMPGGAGGSAGGGAATPGAAGGAGGAGGGSLFKPETETAFQKLPGTLTELTTMMKSVKDVLDRINTGNGNGSNTPSGSGS